MERTPRLDPKFPLLQDGRRHGGPSDSKSILFDAQRCTQQYTTTIHSDASDATLHKSAMRNARNNLNLVCREFLSADSHNMCDTPIKAVVSRWSPLRIKQAMHAEGS